MKVAIVRDGAWLKVDESELIGGRIEGENDDEKVTVIEYCMAGCDDPIHQGPRDPWHPCPKHVHRSVDLQLKKWPEGLGAIAQPLG